MELANQMGLFLLTMATGMGLGVLFDVYRLIRTRCKFRIILTYIGDFVYWVVATCIAFGMLLASNGGEIRFYVFMGLLSGAVFYYQLLSCYVIKNMIKCIHITGIIIKYLSVVWQNIIIKPLRWLVKVILLPFGFSVRILHKLSNRLLSFKPKK